MNLPAAPSSGQFARVFKKSAFARLGERPIESEENSSASISHPKIEIEKSQSQLSYFDTASFISEFDLDFASLTT